MHTQIHVFKYVNERLQYKQWRNVANDLVYCYVYDVTNSAAYISIGYFISTNRLRDESWKA